MIFVLRVCLLFGLMGVLATFSFTACMLAMLLDQPSDMGASRLFGVVAASTVSAATAFGLIALLALHLLGKSRLAERTPSGALAVIGIVFCGLAFYSFLVGQVDQQDDFFQRFAQGARFELLLIGLAAFAMSGTHNAKPSAE